MVIIALAALGLSAWLMWQIQPWRAPVGDPRIEGLEARIGDLENQSRAFGEGLAAAVGSARVADLEQRVEDIARGREQADPALAALTQRVERAEAGMTLELEGIRERVAEAERLAAQRVAQLQQRLDALTPEADHDSARVAELQALLRLDQLLAAARDRLELLGDLSGASRTWAAAIERLEAEDRSATLELRQRLRAELDAMSAIHSIDRAEIGGLLLRAARELGGWPLRSATEAPVDASDTVEPGWRGRLGRALDRMIKVERVEADLIDPVELDLARDRVAALLETVALVLTRGEDDLTARLAGEAELRIRALFDIDAPAVAEVVRRLDRLEAEAPAVVPSTMASRMELARLIEALQ